MIDPVLCPAKAQHYGGVDDDISPASVKMQQLINGEFGDCESHQPDRTGDSGHPRPVEHETCVEHVPPHQGIGKQDVAARAGER